MEGRGVGSQGEIEKESSITSFCCLVEYLSSFRGRVSNLGELDCRVEVGGWSRDESSLLR